jgi:hypothetical protein
MMLQSQEPLVEQDLQIAPPPDPNPLIPKLLIAGAVMVLVGVGVYMLNPRKTAEITVQKTDIFAPHTEFKATPGGGQVIGTAAQAEDNVYVVATVSITDKLRLPIFLDSVSATMTSDTGTLQATNVSALDVPRLEQIFPQITPLVSPPAAPPLRFEDAVSPGATRVGTIVFLFPNTSAQAWAAKKSATLTVYLAHDAAPIQVPLP